MKILNITTEILVKTNYFSSKQRLLNIYTINLIEPLKSFAIHKQNCSNDLNSSVVE